MDLHGKERSLDARYPALDNPFGLRILLSDLHALKVRQFQGDYSAVDILVDLRKAIAMAELTGRQSESLRLVYEEDLTQEEAGKRMGLGRTTVQTYLNTAIDKVSEIYYYWARHGEGYVINGKL